MQGYTKSICFFLCVNSVRLYEIKTIWLQMKLNEYQSERISVTYINVVETQYILLFQNSKCRATEIILQTHFFSTKHVVTFLGLFCRRAEIVPSSPVYL